MGDSTKAKPQQKVSERQASACVRRCAAPQPWKLHGVRRVRQRLKKLSRCPARFGLGVARNSLATDCDCPLHQRGTRAESAAEETFLTETAIGREDASPELSDEANRHADVARNLRVQKGVGRRAIRGRSATRNFRGWDRALIARRDGRPIWSEAAIAEAVASNALSDEQLVAAEKELAAARAEADERAGKAKQARRAGTRALHPRTDRPRGSSSQSCAN